MKKLEVALFLLVFAILATACSGTTTSTASLDALIEPGEKIGDFLITTGVQGNFTYPFDIPCTEPGENNTSNCEAPVGKAINISTGIYDKTGSGNLDQIWTKSNYQMFINDRPVDMKAFGIIEYEHPSIGIIRFANVTIIASNPGEITVRDTGLYDNGEAFESTSIYSFSSP